MREGGGREKEREKEEERKKEGGKKKGRKNKREREGGRERDKGRNKARREERRKEEKKRKEQVKKGKKERRRRGRKERRRVLPRPLIAFFSIEVSPAEKEHKLQTSPEIHIFEEYFEEIEQIYYPKEENNRIAHWFRSRHSWTTEY